MKKTLSIIMIRRAATVAVLLISGAFIAFTIYFWLTYRNVLSADVQVSADKILLTNFNTSKFDHAENRLEKRRNLVGPAENIHDPFGRIPE